MLYRCIYAPDGGKEVFQLVLPQCLQQNVLSSLHDNHGHQGVERTLQLVIGHVWQKISRNGVMSVEGAFLLRLCNLKLGPSWGVFRPVVHTR